MRHTRTKLALATVICSVLALTLPAQGQDVSQPAWRGHLALAVSRASRPRIAGRMPATRSLATKVQGQDALATAEALQEPVPLISSPLQPVTVEHQGRLLVLTYGPKPTGGLMADAGPRGEPPRFAVYRGQPQIASGQFEYG